MTSAPFSYHRIVPFSFWLVEGLYYQEYWHIFFLLNIIFLSLFLLAFPHVICDATKVVIFFFMASIVNGML